jgi:type VI secretion system secreted protein VgrG
VPVTVARPGVSLLPRVGDPVVVVFLDGDLAQPVVIGAIYASAEQPPKAGPLDAVYKPADAEDSSVRRLHLETPSGGVLTLDDERLTLTLGGTEVVVNQDGDVTITAAGAISLEADGDITIAAGGSVLVKAKQDVTLDAQVNLSAKANAAASLEGAASGKVKAANLTIAGLVNFSAA